MKLVSWNVNGIRACITKGFEESFMKLDADIFCLQETKCQENQVKLELQVIINIGIMRTARDIPEQLFLRKRAVVRDLRTWNRGTR